MAVALSIAIALLQFWPFIIIFFVLGGVATVIIGLLSGQEINYFLILPVEFLLIVVTILCIIYVRAVKNSRKQ
jgi:hypothetical protein